MFFINISEPFTLLLLVIFTVLMIFLGKETKKSFVPGIALAVFLILLVIHVGQLVTLPEGLADVYMKKLVACMVIDFLLVLATYLSYLWIDDIDSKANNKKSISNDLDWLWKKV